MQTSLLAMDCLEVAIILVKLPEINLLHVQEAAENFSSLFVSSYPCKICRTDAKYRGGAIPNCAATLDLLGLKESSFYENVGKFWDNSR